MRYWSVVVVALVMLVAGCSKDIAGVAQVDPRGPATAISEDGFGIDVGDPNARRHIEIYTEPQCDHCADLQKDFGDELRRYTNLGQLLVTYRPLTFLDDEPGGYSDRVSNALFLAAGPQTSAKAFQAFVQDLWGHQSRGSKGPTATEIADMAHDSGVPTPAADAMRAGKPALNLADMEDTNFEYLYEIDPINTGTPTVFDLTKNKTVDIYDNNWLSKLMST
ncbi:DsbA family protein [Mycolicibacterium sarraceniae]|uniref:Protein disulfide-isomerase n=1 Tax=Mycolicibacterium sarraceniae TaxID=1534348 RepID=A0A7I7SR79_9MYCO|nr:thioredoxin domain-containing protein [Mycolicibacterium sarraceniae]BBY59243.1 protein disulfide-isomerase [Mycolicibacterium sarraceniae]